MNKPELIEAISRNTETKKVVIEDVLQQLAAVTAAELREGGEVTVPGIGKLKVAKRAAREGRNPKTGEPLKIAARVAVKFSAAKALKDAVA